MNAHIREDKRREIVDLLEHWRAKTGLSAKQLAQWCSLPYKKFLSWRRRAQQPEKPAKRVVPKSHWLLPLVSENSNRPGSCCIPVVVPKQSAKPLAAFHQPYNSPARTIYHNRHH